MARLPLTPMQRAARLASTQRGLLRIDQAIAAGLSHDQMQRLARSGGWSRLARGLYAAPGSSPSWQRDVLAACLLAGDGTVASLLTAAALWQWCRPPLLPDVTVAVPGSTRTRLATVHRARAPIPAADRTVRDGVPCTTASRTIVDCSGIVERPVLEQFVDDALCSHVASVSSIRAAAERAGRRGRIGMDELDGVLAVWQEDIEPDSQAEVRLLRRLDLLGVTGAVTQHEVRDADGTFVARLDVALPALRRGFEYDSDRFHNPRNWDRDERRYARLRALGWRVDPVCKLDLLPSSTRLADLLGVRA